MEKATMSAYECCKEMRELGIPCTVTGIVDGIECGAYGFGRIKKRGPTGRRTVEIFRVEFQRWIREKVTA